MTLLREKVLSVAIVPGTVANVLLFSFPRGDAGSRATGSSWPDRPLRYEYFLF